MTKNGQKYPKIGKYDKKYFLLNKGRLENLFAKQFGAIEGVASELSIFHYFCLPPVLESCQILKILFSPRVIFFEGLV